MKKNFKYLAFVIIAGMTVAACNNQPAENAENDTMPEAIEQVAETPVIEEPAAAIDTVAATVKEEVKATAKVVKKEVKEAEKEVVKPTSKVIEEKNSEKIAPKKAEQKEEKTFKRKTL